jgi:hypothetical protein
LANTTLLPLQKQPNIIPQLHPMPLNIDKNSI